jgi:zinc transport system substrate-binding protein
MPTMNQRINCSLLVFFALITFSASVYAAQQPLKVVATIFPLADIVRQIGGSRVTVSALLTAGMSEHTSEPTTAQIRQVADAALYVRVGAGLDTWGDKLLAAAKRPPVIVTATAGIPLLSVAEQELVTEKSKKKHHHHNHEGDDPHVWLDPILVRDHVVPGITKALIALSPADTGYFKANSKNFATALTNLDREMRPRIKALSRHDFIALHGAWHYMAKRYGLRQLAAVEPFPGKEPSAKYIAALISLAKKDGVTTIFAEPQLSAKAAQVIAAELKGKVLLLDPVGGETVPGRNSYLELMRYNLLTIERGMK